MGESISIKEMLAAQEAELIDLIRWLVDKGGLCPRTEDDGFHCNNSKDCRCYEVLRLLENREGI